jgi:crotonobetainyl-CoA:carnitine CoA-transferase CaiB-like acyl-CoA transferase
VSTRTDLNGIKVLELAAVLAGPAVGTFLAELGATVTKVENPHTGGDMTRSWKLPSEPTEQQHSAYFCSVNWGKKHVFIDLRSEEGHAEAMRLAADADIVLTNFRPGDDHKLRLDFETVKAVNPDVIYGSINGYGADNPRAAFDVVLQAEAGFMALNGFADRPPVKFPLAIIDMLAAHQLKQGLLLALFNRERTGKGCHVTASLFDAAISALSNYATNWLMGGHLSQRDGGVHPNICPYGDILTCSDGRMIVLAAATDAQFKKLCAILETPSLAEESIFSTVQQRVGNREILMERLNTISAHLDRDSLLGGLHAEGIPAGAIRGLDEALALPEAQAMLLQQTLDDGSQTVRPAQVGFRMGNT